MAVKLNEHFLKFNEYIYKSRTLQSTLFVDNTDEAFICFICVGHSIYYLHTPPPPMDDLIPTGWFFHNADSQGSLFYVMC